MTSIDESYLETIVYLYGSEQDATDRKRSPGGTGFIVGISDQADLGEDMPSEIIHHYAVTAGHVIDHGGTFICLNKKDGGYATLAPGKDQWRHHATADVAMCPIELDEDVFNFHYIPSCNILKSITEFQTRSRLGGDVFMPGRFVEHEGKQKNLPVVRFGNVAMLPHEEIEIDKLTHPQECFLVDMRSLSGFSGSPVFVYDQIIPMPLIKKMIMKQQAHVDLRVRESQPRLLGIDIAMLGVERDTYLVPDQNNPTNRVQLGRVAGNSGLSAVVAAWKILDLIKSEELAALRVERRSRLELEAARATANE